MSKWVEVPVTILKTYAVEIKDNETISDAVNAVTEECLGDIEIDNKNCFIGQTYHDVNNIKIMADEVLAL